MTKSQNRLIFWLGFNAAVPEERAYLAPALALSGALAALPFLLLLLLDTDRAIPLAFLPAVWLSWRVVRPASKFEIWLLVWAFTAMLVSAVLADNPARALVMTSAVGWTLAGAMVARNLASCLPAVRLVLVGIVVGAVLGMMMVCWGAGANRMFFPTYWSARLFGAHEFIGCVAALGLLSLATVHLGSKMLIASGALTTMTGLAWSGSRAPALGLALIIALWFWRGTTQERRLLIRWIPLLAVLSLVFSYPLGNPYPQLGWWDAFERTASASSVEGLSSERSRFWTVVWHGIEKSPWIGHGADAYLFLHPRQNGNQPHNVVLQWLLEFGLLGAVPLALLLGSGIRGLFRNTYSSRLSNNPLQIWAPAAVAGTAVYGLLDGVFYHMIIFMPAAVIVGFSFGQRIPGTTRPEEFRITPFVRPALLIGMILLLVHNWLNLMLLRARHVEPDSPPAKILRAFPSITYGLQNWTDAWERTQPAVAVEWLKWASTVSTEQNLFHIHLAQIHLRRKEFRAAEAELLQCMEKGPEIERTDLMNLITKVRASAAAKEAAADSLPHS